VISFFQDVLFHYFVLNKTTAEAHRFISETYSKQAPSQKYVGTDLTDSEVISRS